jgi:hypothetical protein
MFKPLNRCAPFKTFKPLDATPFDHEAHEGFQKFVILTFVIFVCFVVILPLAFDCGAAALG